MNLSVNLGTEFVQPPLPIKPVALQVTFNRGYYKRISTARKKIGFTKDQELIRVAVMEYLQKLGY